MTDIEKKALVLVNETAVKFHTPPWHTIDRRSFLEDVICRAIEQHEAFRQEVSDAIYVDVVAQVRCGIDPKFRTNSVRFVIAKPDPLVEAIEDAWGPDLSGDNYKRASASLREAIAKRGGKIVWED